MSKLGLMLAILIAFAAAPALADPSPSFDCAKASSAPERAICKDEVLAWQDRQMNRLYAEVRQLVSEGERVNLRNDQRDWITRRNNCGSTTDCIARVYWARLQALANQISPRLLTGSYIYSEKGFEGALNLVEFPGNRAAATIDTINTGRLHTCSVDLADLRVDRQTLSWEDPEEYEGKHCRVDITVGPGGAVVAAQNCQNWCGAAGIFEGRYRRR